MIDVPAPLASRREVAADTWVLAFEAPGVRRLPPGATAELPLRIRVLNRERQGAMHPYQVQVQASGSVNLWASSCGCCGCAWRPR